MEGDLSATGHQRRRREERERARQIADQLAADAESAEEVIVIRDELLGKDVEIRRREGVGVFMDPHGPCEQESTGGAAEESVGGLPPPPALGVLAEIPDEATVAIGLAPADSIDSMDKDQLRAFLRQHDVAVSNNAGLDRLRVQARELTGAADR